MTTLKIKDLGLQTCLTKSKKGDFIQDTWGDDLLVTIKADTFAEIRELKQDGTIHKNRRPKQFGFSNIEKWWHRQNEVA